MSNDTSTLISLFRLAQLSDGSFPVGSFSFSHGLESALAEGIVTDTLSLENYARALLYATAECDAIALLEAFRAASVGDYRRIVEADQQLYSFKAGEEARAMTRRMGRRLAHLVCSILPTHLSKSFYALVEKGETIGTHPIAQAVAGFALDTDERALYAAHLYGVVSSLLSAALRLMPIAHFDSQRILLRLAPLCETLYESFSEMTLEQMSSFAPTLELAASLHERGRGRLFMN